jgi:multidrug efflux pump subunit AcrA (membrane-fusion protein)
MRARISVQDRDLGGVVTQVANQADPWSLYSNNARDYATIVKIDGKQHDLKPGMTAEVEIVVADLQGVLSAPVQAVIEEDDKNYCYVMTVDGLERRRVTLGLEGSTGVEVCAGLAENDEVLLDPRSSEIVALAGDEIPTVEEAADPNAAPGVPDTGQVAGP